MLSWRRLAVLLKTLELLPKATNVNYHLILQVQGSEDLCRDSRNAILENASLSPSSDVYFTRDNVGTAHARLGQLVRAVKTTNSELLMYTDDDITFPVGGIDKQVEAMKRYPECGTVSLNPRGLKRVYAVTKDGAPIKMYKRNPEISEVYLVGSASLMFRRELFTHHMIAPDPAYYIGTWDWDFITQVRKAGYPLLQYHSIDIINRRGGDKKYKQKRNNKIYIHENRTYFKSKWGVDPFKLPKEFKQPVRSNFERRSK